MNKTIAHVLQASLLGKPKRKPQPLYHDLDALAGSWSGKQAAEFDKTLAAQRRIDEDVWK